MQQQIAQGWRDDYDLEHFLGSLLGIRDIINSQRSCRSLQVGVSTRTLIQALPPDERPLGWESIGLVQWRAGNQFRFKRISQSKYKQGIYSCLPRYSQLQSSREDIYTVDFDEVHVAYQIVECLLPRPGWHGQRRLACLAARTTEPSAEPRWTYLKIGCQDICRQVPAPSMTSALANKTASR